MITYLIFYVINILLISIGFSFVIYLDSIEYTKIFTSFFADNISFKNFPVFIKWKVKSYHYFIVMSLILSGLNFALFWFLYIPFENIIFAIILLSLFIINIVLILVGILIIFKKLKKYNHFSKREVIIFFDSYIKQQIKNTKYIEFWLILPKNVFMVAPIAFLFNQNKFKNKVNEINFEGKNILKVFNLFISYLKVYAILMNRIQKSDVSPIISINGEVISLTYFKSILINNFISFINIKSDNN